MTKEQKLILELEERLIHGVSDDRTISLIRNHHPAMAAEQLVRFCEPHIGANIVTKLEHHLAADMIGHMDADYRGKLLGFMDTETTAAVFSNMSHDDRVDSLHLLDENTAEAILKSLPASEQADIRKLEEYPEGKAGSIMTTDLLELKAEFTVADALETARKTATDRETIYVGYAVQPAHVRRITDLPHQAQNGFSYGHSYRRIPGRRCHRIF
ncbi:hypothetical protein QA596_10370 [Balneolales bacterium ANBcel1]|nr:hypothetical protein [Balneolales bacterium ANBcel1]